MNSGAFKSNRILGILVAAICGALIIPGWDWLVIAFGAQNQNTGGLSLAFAGVWIILAGVGAWLMRTWWAVLVVPVVFYLGFLVGSVLDTLLLGSVLAGDYFLLGAIVGIFYTIPVALVSLIATALSKRAAPRAA
jgi:hypothetical protein